MIANYSKTDPDMSKEWSDLLSDEYSYLKGRQLLQEGKTYSATDNVDRTRGVNNDGGYTINNRLQAHGKDQIDRTENNGCK